MTLNFPSAPTNGQVYAAEGVQFVWNGDVWHTLPSDPFPWASNAQAVQGKLRDVFLTPASAKAQLDAAPPVVPVGVGVPTDMNATRTINTTYTNELAVPMFVSACIDISTGNTGYLSVKIGPTSPTLEILVVTDLAGGGGAGVLFIVPPGWKYSITESGSGTGSEVSWTEYR